MYNWRILNIYPRYLLYRCFESVEFFKDIPHSRHLWACAIMSNAELWLSISRMVKKKIAANKQQQYSMSLKLANNVVTAETAQLTIPWHNILIVTHIVIQLPFCHPLAEPEQKCHPCDFSESCFLLIRMANENINLINSVTLLWALD